MRYANITSIPSSYIVAFFSSLGDASPPGEDASTTGEDAFLTRAYVRVHNIYLETFFVPCFIFITQCIDNQYFQEMKHWHSMFHFWFQCFRGVSSIGFWFLSHWGFKSLPLGFDFSPSVFLEGDVVNKKMKHWNIKWNIECLCFISWNVWFSRSWNLKMKHETDFTNRYNIYTCTRACARREYW